MVRNFFAREDLGGRYVAGQGLAEYALLLALIAVVCIVAVTFLGTRISAILSGVGASI
jgi:pilus assembly protein Flp/PilA